MNKTAVHAIIMVLTTILAKVLGFCRELSLAFSYGAGSVSDAYVVAFTLPTILFSGLGTAMLTSYISVYTDLQQNHPGEEKPFHNRWDLSPSLWRCGIPSCGCSPSALRAASWTLPSTFPR